MKKRQKDLKLVVGRILRGEKPSAAKTNKSSKTSRGCKKGKKQGREEKKEMEFSSSSFFFFVKPGFIFRSRRPPPWLCMKTCVTIPPPPLSTKAWSQCSGIAQGYMPGCLRRRPMHGGRNGGGASSSPLFLCHSNNAFHYTYERFIFEAADVA